MGELCYSDDARPLCVELALVVQWIERLRPKEEIWAETVWGTVSEG